MCTKLLTYVAFLETLQKFILFLTVMKNSNRRNLLFVLDKPVKLTIVGKDIPSGLSWWIMIWAVTPNKNIKTICPSYTMERNCQFHSETVVIANSFNIA